ncbi:MAG: hypothetical protein GY730_04965 [bacterium]|nr:hypothetical protein [bacterium]
MKNRIEILTKIRLTKHNYDKLKRINERTGKSINFLINILVLNTKENEVIKKLEEGEFF